MQVRLHQRGFSTAGVGDLYHPAAALQNIMHEPGAGHRLDHCPYPLTWETGRQSSQPVRIRRRRQPAEKAPLPPFRPSREVASPGP
mgnify:CR=1 FL=1